MFEETKQNQTHGFGQWQRKERKQKRRREKEGDGGHRGKEAARKKLLIAHPY